MKKVAILQPEVPHYRKDFFDLLKNKLEVMDIYIFNSIDAAKKQGFSIESKDLLYIPNCQIKGILFYNPFFLLRKDYDGMILMLNFTHITTWLLLITKFIHRKKIVLWGQGISVKRYLQEEVTPDWKLKWMISLADGIMLYTEKELEMWRRIFPNKKMVALNNTLSGAQSMVEYVSFREKDELKKQYGVKEKTILIFCARFESAYRRTDLLIETIERLDNSRFGFIIIGAGKHKPDFSNYSNVYDFGAVYDTKLKQDLFTIADIYFQPGWVGLSIVEAMAYGKPIFTFKRTEKTKQCVEYAYVKSHENGIIFENMDDCIEQIENISEKDLLHLGFNARLLVKRYLVPDQMVSNAYSLINKL